MTILGIDPGPNGFAWAVYDAKRNEVTAWGDWSKDISPEWRVPDGVVAAAIERPGMAGIVGKSTLDTAFNAGMLFMALAFYPLRTLLLHRKTIAAALTGSARSGDKEINLALGRLVPSFADKRKGLNGHHRAAAAVAFVAAGRVSNRDLIAGKGE